MAKAKQPPEQKSEKFTIEFKNDQKQITEIWHYNMKKFSRGPILVEILENNPPKRKTKTK